VHGDHAHAGASRDGVRHGSLGRLGLHRNCASSGRQKRLCQPNELVDPNGSRRDHILAPGKGRIVCGFLGSKSHGARLGQGHTANDLAEKAHRPLLGIEERRLQIGSDTRHDCSRKARTGPDVEKATSLRHQGHTADGIGHVLAEQRATIPFTGQSESTIPDLEEVEESADAAHRLRLEFDTEPATAEVDEIPLVGLAHE